MSWEEVLLSCFSCFFGNAIFCSLFCPVISPSTKILWSTDNDQMESLSVLVCEAESNLFYHGLSFCLYCRSGSLFCVEGLVKSSINHPCRFFMLLSNDTEAHVLCGEGPFCTPNPICFLGSATISLVRIWSWAAITGRQISCEREMTCFSHLKGRGLIITSPSRAVKTWRISWL